MSSAGWDRVSFREMSLFLVQIVTRFMLVFLGMNLSLYIKVHSDFVIIIGH